MSSPLIICWWRWWRRVSNELRSAKCNYKYQWSKWLRWYWWGPIIGWWNIRNGGNDGSGGNGGNPRTGGGGGWVSNGTGTNDAGGKAAFSFLEDWLWRNGGFGVSGGRIQVHLVVAVAIPVAVVAAGAPAVTTEVPAVEAEVLTTPVLTKVTVRVSAVMVM